MWSENQNAIFMPKHEIKSELLCCRGCLGAGKLYNMHQYGLTEPYALLTGIQLVDPSRPQQLCSICRALLVKYLSFRRRCQEAEMLLQNLAEVNSVTLEAISAVDRLTHGLETYTINRIEDISYPQPEEPTEPLITEQPTHEKLEEPDDDYLQEPTEEPDCTYEDPPLTPEPKRKSRKHKQKITFEMEDLQPLSTMKSEMKTKKIRKTKVNNDPEDLTKLTENYDADITISSIKKCKKPRVNNLYTDPADRAKFAERYDVDIVVMRAEDEHQEMVDRKNSDKYIRAHNKCEQCYKGFIHEDTLKRHVKDKHDESLEHVCEYCRFRFKARANLSGHYRRHHKYKYVCRACGTTTRMREHAVQHSKMHTQKFECKYCLKTFKSKGTTYHTHVRSKHAAELPWCRVCGDAFISTKAHMDRLHKETLSLPAEWRCSKCDTQFLSSEAHYRHTHARTHTQRAACGGAHWCVHCAHYFDEEQALREHVLALHKVQYPCTKCNKIFNHESRLNNHVLEKHSDDDRTHPARKRYMKVEPAMCHVCGKIIATPYHMRYHQRIHTGEKPYACADCPKRFRMPDQLQNHARIHTGERPFKCKYCPKSFKTYPAMSRHHLVHTGVRRHACSVCDKGFATSAEMKAHVRTVHMKVPPRPRAKRYRTPHT